MHGPTGTVTLVFTDLQGSTEHWEHLGDRFASCLARHNEVIRDQIRAHHGYEVKTEGDAFMVAFEDAPDAVNFAVDLQLEMRHVTVPDSEDALLVRVGMHSGEPLCERDETTGRMDYFGPSVNRAARISAAANGGQILISGSTHESLGAERPDLIVRDFGEHRLKGLERPEHIYEVAPQELAARDHPPIRTLTGAPTNLPYQTTSFIGRQRECSELVDLLREPSTALVTMTGPGGLGKTRLSLRVGSELLDEFEGGCWFADLTEVTSAEGISAAVASGFGAPLTSREAPEKVVAAILEYRKPLLLILDNFEQVVDFAASTVGMWMKRAPHVKFLITSRILLGLGSEREYELQPFAAPARSQGGKAVPQQGVTAVKSYEVVQLFLERARDAKPGYTLSGDNANDILDLCTHLDGIPLAIELAAARIKIMKPSQMVQRLTKKFELLRSSRRDLPRRQQTLEGAIDWSYDLLTEWERSAFCQACAFRGGFFLDAAESIISLEDFDDAPLAMDAVQSLREKSLLTTYETPYEIRFGMYMAIRDYGLQKSTQIIDHEHIESLYARHGEFYIGYCQEWDAQRGSEQALEAFDRLEMDAENIFAVQDRSLERGDTITAAKAILGLAVTMAVRGLTGERVPRLERSLDALDTAADATLDLRITLMNALCLAYHDVGDWDRAIEVANRAVELAERRGRSANLGDSLIKQGDMRRLRGDLEGSLNCFQQAESIFQELGEQGGLGRAINGRGSVLWQRGDYDEALQCFTKAAEIFRKAGNQAGVARSIGGKGIVLGERRDYSGALKCYAEAEQINRLLGNKAAIARTLGNKAIELRERNELDEALACFSEAESINRELGAKAMVAWNIGNRGVIYEMQDDHEKALHCYAEAEAVHRDLSNAAGIALDVARRAQPFLALSRPKEARSALEEALQIYEDTGTAHTRPAYNCLVLLAETLHVLGEPSAAGAVARRAIKLGEELGLVEHYEDPKSADRADLLRRLATDPSAP